MITGNMRRFTISALSVGGVVLAASVGWTQTVVVVPPTSPPPPPLVETIPSAPSSTVQSFSWQPGHWSWIDGRWAWTQGSYIVAQAPGAVWEPGYWHMDPGGAYVWVEGHWR